jgi:hypothetical protein
MVLVGQQLLLEKQKGLKSKTSKLKMIEHVVHFCQMKVIKICVYCALSYLLLITHKMCTLIIYIYIDVLSCFYDGLSEEYTTIIGGDFNVDITNEDTNLKGKSLTHFLNALTSKLPLY